MAEFTGERVIPGKVDIDLWNEHHSRYLFAARLSRGKRVIDLGCGSGYGAAEIAKTAESVSAVDISAEAIAEAALLYPAENLHFESASLEQLPFADGSFHLGVCFEVIEHIENFRAVLAEARRVITENGQLIISTPNKLYYAETRKVEGPNPFHVHEFEFQEFRALLSEFFPHQIFFVQNHASAISFLPIDGQAAAELRIEGHKSELEEAHFFLAVCANRPLTGAPAFVYLPAAANVLRERELHIARLEEELATKQQWLQQSQDSHASLVELYRNLQSEMEAKNNWALQQNERINKAVERIGELEAETQAERQKAEAIVAAYQQRVTALEAEQMEHSRLAEANNTRLEQELSQIAAHSQKLDQELQGLRKELADCVSLLDRAEAQVVERTQWAQSEASLRQLAEEQLASIEASRWIKMGRVFGLGPKKA